MDAEMNVLNANFRRGLCALALLLAAGLLSACETTSTGSPSVEAATPDVAAAKTPDLPMTRERAATECWMSTEKGHADMPLDKRADIVTKCIDDKLSGKKTAAIAPEKSKTKPAPETKPKSDKPTAEITPKPSPKPKAAAKPKTDDKPESEPKADDGAEPKPKG